MNCRYHSECGKLGISLARLDVRVKAISERPTVFSKRSREIMEMSSTAILRYYLYNATNLCEKMLSIVCLHQSSVKIFHLYSAVSLECLNFLMLGWRHNSISRCYPSFSHDKSHYHCKQKHPRFTDK